MTTRRKTLGALVSCLLAALLAAPAALPACAHAGPRQEPATLPEAMQGTPSRDRVVEAVVLLYHFVEPLSSGSSIDRQRERFVVSPQAFAANLGYLRKHGYESIDLYRLYGALVSGSPLPQRPVVITFDDGESSLYHRVFPLMREYGFTGTIFMITRRTDEGRTGYLTWDQALEMARAGWRLEPHTETHPFLPGKSRAFQYNEIAGSAAALAGRLGYAPRFFAYPFGRYDATTIRVLEEAGLWGALTTAPGRVHSLSSVYELARMEVFSSTTQDAFVRLLAGNAPVLAEAGDQ